MMTTRCTAAPRSALALLSLLLAGGAVAQEPANTSRVAPEDFAYGFTVATADDSPIVQLTLPDDLYRSVYRTDLGDLRVFDRSGAIVPHAVRHDTMAAAERPAPRSVPVFPVRGPAGDAGGRVRVVTDDKGAIIEAVTAGLVGGDAAGSERITAYMVDLGAEPENVERLELEWTQEPGPGFTSPVDVQGSSNLSTWSPVATGVMLADLRSGSDRLRNRTITLPPAPGRYLRIGWPAALRDVRLTGTQIVYAPAERALDRHTRLVNGTVANEDGTAVYVFDTGGSSPIDRARVVFRDRNRVLAASLFSRAADDQEWHLRHAGTHYRLEHNGADVASEFVTLTVTPDRYWKLEPASPQDSAAEAPQLEIGWVPHQLMFVRQGEPPYTVAYGSASVAPADDPGAQLFAAVDRAARPLDSDRGTFIAQARAQDVFTLGGPSRLEPPAPPLPWRTWVLWAVLLAGVALLAWMVLRLARQMG